MFRGPASDRELLLVKEHDGTHWLFPGGTCESNESVEAALRRELQEELSTDVQNVRAVGIVVGQTPDGRPLEMHLYTGEPISALKPGSEIQSVQWIRRADVSKLVTLTPITTERVFPLLASLGLW